VAKQENNTGQPWYGRSVAARAGSPFLRTQRAANACLNLRYLHVDVDGSSQQTAENRDNAMSAAAISFFAAF
jgi:hypothetical protein